ARSNGALFDAPTIAPHCVQKTPSTLERQTVQMLMLTLHKAKVLAGLNLPSNESCRYYNMQTIAGLRGTFWNGEAGNGRESRAEIGTPERQNPLFYRTKR
ncbi:MAG TPA: hypothetical protein VFH72_14115, partial [Candidatus Baltobacteraceae bacterium]|nr:hypothetical protein [Candidatus Baltobacteraceae bacterium]